MVLGAFNEVALDPSFRQVLVAVGAEAIRGMDLTVGGAVEREAALLVIEAKGFFHSQCRTGADVKPAVDQQMLSVVRSHPDSGRLATRPVHRFG